MIYDISGIDEQKVFNKCIKYFSNLEENKNEPYIN